MSVRRTSNDAGSIQVRSVKKQICEGIGFRGWNLSIDQLVRIAANQGFSVVVSCVKLSGHTAEVE